MKRTTSNVGPSSKKPSSPVGSFVIKTTDQNDKNNKKRSFSSSKKSNSSFPTEQSTADGFHRETSIETSSTVTASSSAPVSGGRNKTASSSRSSSRRQSFTSTPSFAASTTTTPTASKTSNKKTKKSGSKSSSKTTTPTKNQQQQQQQQQEDPFANVKPLTMPNANRKKDEEEATTISVSAEENTNNNNNDAKQQGNNNNNNKSSTINIQTHPFQQGGPRGVSQSSLVYPMFPDQTRLFRILDGDRLLFYNDTPNTDFVIRIKFLGSRKAEDIDKDDEEQKMLLLLSSDNDDESQQQQKLDNTNENDGDSSATVQQQSSIQIIPDQVLQEVQPRGSAKWYCESGMEFDFTRRNDASSSSSSQSQADQNNNNNNNKKKQRKNRLEHFIIDIIQPGETSVFAQGKGVAKGYSIIFGHRNHVRSDPTAEPLSIDYKKYQHPVLKELLMKKQQQQQQKPSTTTATSSNNNNVISFSSSSPRVYPVFPDGTRLFRIHDGKTLYFYNDTSDKQYYLRIDFEEAATNRPITLLGSATRSIPSEPGLCTDYILPTAVQPFATGEFLMSHFTMYVLEMKMAEKSTEVMCGGLDSTSNEDENNNNAQKQQQQLFKFNVTPEGWDRSLLHSSSSSKNSSKQSRNIDQSSSSLFPPPAPRFVSVFPIIFGKLYRIHDGDRTLLYNDTKDENFEVTCEFPLSSHVLPIGNAIKKKKNSSQNQPSTPTSTSNQQQQQLTIAITDIVYNTKTQPFCKGDISTQTISVISHKIEASEEEKQKRFQQEQAEEKLRIEQEQQKHNNDSNAEDDTKNNQTSSNNDENNNQQQKQRNSTIKQHEDEKNILRKAPIELIDPAQFNFNGVGPMHLNDSSRVFSMLDGNSKLFRVIDEKNKMLYVYNDTDSFEFVVKVQFRIPKLPEEFSHNTNNHEEENNNTKSNKRVIGGGLGRRRVTMMEDRDQKLSKNQNENDDGLGNDDEYTKLVKSNRRILPTGTAVLIDDPQTMKKLGAFYHIITILDTVPPLTTHCLAENVNFALFQKNNNNMQNQNQNQKENINNRLPLPGGYRISFAQRLKQLGGGGGNISSSSSSKSPKLKSSSSTTSAFENSVAGVTNARQGRRHSTAQQMTDRHHNQNPLNDLKNANNNNMMSKNQNNNNNNNNNNAQLQNACAIKRFNLSGPYGITMTAPPPSSRPQSALSQHNDVTSTTLSGPSTNSARKSVVSSSSSSSDADESANDDDNNAVMKREAKQRRRTEKYLKRQVPCQEFLTFDCFDGDGMLYRIVTLPGLNKWYFYNDTVDAEMHVNVKFFNAKNLRKPPNSSTVSIVHSSDRNGDIDLVTDIILPGETNCFVEADEISNFSCNFSAKSVTALHRKKMKETGAPLIAEDRRRFSELTFDVLSPSGSNHHKKNDPQQQQLHHQECIDLCVENWVSFIDVSFPPSDQSIYRPSVDHSDPGFVSWIRATNLLLHSSGNNKTEENLNDNNNNFASSSASLLLSSSNKRDNATTIFSHQKDENQLTNGMRIIGPHFVRDSALGNQWLSCAIAILAEFPDFIRDIFTCAALRDLSRRRTEQYLGVHRVCYINRNQEWWTSSDVIDDFLPCVGLRSLCCIRHKTRPARELWVSLIEKLFAKLMGSYSAILGGDPLVVFSTVTGFPCSRFEAKDFKEAKENDKKELMSSGGDHQQQQQQQQYIIADDGSILQPSIIRSSTTLTTTSTIFESFRDAFTSGNIVTFSTKSSYFLADAVIAIEEQLLKDTGLELDRTYAIVDVKYFKGDTVGGDDLKLVQVRNVWWFHQQENLLQQQQDAEDDATASAGGSTNPTGRRRGSMSRVGSRKNSFSSSANLSSRRLSGRRRSSFQQQVSSSRRLYGNAVTTSSAAFEFDADRNNDDDFVFDDEEDELNIVENDPDVMVSHVGWKGAWSPLDKQWSKMPEFVARSCNVDLIYPGAQHQQHQQHSTSQTLSSHSTSQVLSSITTPLTKQNQQQQHHHRSFYEQQQYEKEQQERKAAQLKKNKHSFWIEWQDLLRYINSAGICYSNRLWSNFRLRSSFSLHDGTSPVAFKVRCKPSANNSNNNTGNAASEPLSVIFCISQPGLPQQAVEARGGRPYMSVSLAMLQQHHSNNSTASGSQSITSPLTTNEPTKPSTPSPSSSSSSSSTTKYSLKLVSGKIINNPTFVDISSSGTTTKKNQKENNNDQHFDAKCSPIEHFASKYIGFKYDFYPSSSEYFYIIPHCDIVLPSDDPKALTFSLCYYCSNSNSTNNNNNTSSKLEVQFVQIQQSEKWFEEPLKAHDVIATPVDEDYQCKVNGGSKPVARHGWTFDVPS